MGSSFPLWDREGPLLPNIMWFKTYFLFLSVISIAVSFDIYDQRNPLYKRNSYMAYSGQNYDRTLPYVPRYSYAPYRYRVGKRTYGGYDWENMMTDGRFIDLPGFAKLMEASRAASGEKK